MLARSILPVPQSQCSTSLSLRAGPQPMHQGRVLVVSKASYPSRSSSPRSDSWRSSWRTELEHGSNGNGNGAHAQSHDAHQIEARNGKVWQLGQDQGSDNLLGGEGSSGGGFFTDSFKEALKAALQRSPLYGEGMAGTMSADEEVTDPQPYENEVEVYNRPIFTDQFRTVLKDSLARRQAELDAYGGNGSDDEYTPTPYVPSAPPPREMSPIEEVIATALGASQLHLRRLTLMKNEIEAALEREAKQIERLEFALSKAQSDMAYYKSMESMLEQRKGQ